MFGKVKSLRELFEIELAYAYDCEQKLVEKGLPAMIENATYPQLQAAFKQHLQETMTHVVRLEEVFASLGAAPKTKSNDILDRMTAAAKDSVSNIDPSALRDAALIVNGNLVEHYEIALYGSMIAFARNLGLEKAVGLLEEILADEKQADAKLTQLAESMNPQAARRQTA